MNRTLIIAMLVALTTVAALGQVLPDGKPFPTWEDKTSYQKTYHVSQTHPNASDDNPGTLDQPFKTINRAAQVLRPGEKVLIHPGVYRETVMPARGGAGPDQMIAYEAAPGAKVIVTGGETVTTPWGPSKAGNGAVMSLKLWQTSLRSVMEMEGDSPFSVLNASEADIDIMPWAEQWKGMVPYTLLRGMVFQNGRRLTQLAHYDDLFKVEGAFWVDRTSGTLHIHPFDRADPNEARMEVTARQQLFRPREVGLSFIKVKGLIFERAGNGFPRIGVGAVYVNGGDHWIIEDNIVRQINSVGIEIGARVTERVVSSDAENQRVNDHPGGMIVRNNEIYQCGTGAIQGHNVRNGLLENNHLYHIGWQDAEYYWECAAVKLLINEGTLVVGNVIHDVEAACAVWLDWDNRNSRIAKNVIYDIYPASGGALYVEASKSPNMIDHNILWNVAGLGISVYDSDRTLVSHNLIGRCGVPWSSRVNTTGRKVQDQPLTSKDNRFAHNILYQNGQLPIIEDEENFSDRNFFSGHDFQAWQSRGWGSQSHTGPLTIEFDAGQREIRFSRATPWPFWKTGDGWPGGDFYGRPFRDGAVYPGPFQAPFVGEIVFRW